MILNSIFTYVILIEKADCDINYILTMYKESSDR